MANFSRAALLCATLATLAAFTARPAAASPKLEGSWSVSVTTYNCASGMKNPPFTSLLSFAAGGTEVETTSNPALALGQRSPGFGNWLEVSSGHYRMTTQAFILFGTPAAPPAPPIPQGMQQIKQKIHLLSTHSWTSTATIEYFDTTGALALTGCANAVATRLDNSNS